MTPPKRQAAPSTRVLSDAIRENISDLVFEGGWVNFVDANSNPIPLSQLPNLRSFRSDIDAIPCEAFYECKSLQVVSLPYIDAIPREAFFGCKSLQTVNLPLATSIGRGAFYLCTGLKSVSLPLVESIGKRAFDECPNLAEVDLHSVRSIGEDAFDEYSYPTIRIPENIINAYWGCYHVRPACTR